MFKKYPALYLLLFAVAGIIFADIIRINSLYFLTGILIFGLMALFLRGEKCKFLLPLFVGITILMFTSFRFAVATYDFGQTHISHFIDSDTRFIIYGEVSDWVDIKYERTEIQLTADSLKGNKVYKVHGDILVRVNVETTSFQRGDKLIIEGRMFPIRNRQFSDEFDYQRFLSYMGISGIVYLNTDLQILLDKGNRYSIFTIVDIVRDWIRDTFYNNLNEEAAALASGFLIGETREISPELYQRFKDSGTLHLLAVSGSNVVLVLGFFLYIFRPFSLSKRKRTIILLIVLVLFVLLSYEEPSVVRASVMAGLVLLANLFERRYNLNNIIAMTALLILLFEPTQLFNLGFQLSFIIAWGLIVTLPQLAKLFDAYKNKNWYRFFVFPFLVSLVAQIYSTGLVGLYFDRIPLLSPFANLIIVPLVSLAVIGIQILLAANFILPILGQFVGSLLNPLFSFTIAAVNMFGGEGMLFIDAVDWEIIYVLIIYVLLFYLSALFFNKKARRISLITGLMLTLIIMIHSLYTVYNSSEMTKVEVISVPGGSVTIFQHNIDHYDIVVHGVSARKYGIDEKILIPEFSKRSIKKINKLFIMTADYHAIDDLLRFAKTYNVESIYYEPAIENSLLEINNQFNFKFDNFHALYSTQSMDQDGYSADNGNLCFKLKQNSVWFLHSVSGLEQMQIPEGKNIFILDRVFQIKDESFENIKNMTFICANSEQVNQLGSIKSQQGHGLEIYSLYDSDIPVFEYPQ